MPGHDGQGYGALPNYGCPTVITAARRRRCRRGSAPVYSVPLRTRFRGIDVRDGVLVRGPAGWGEFSPFWDYDVAESRRWWAAARRGRRRGLAGAGARPRCRST